VKCRLCHKPVRRYDVSSASGITISLPGSTESHDSERRRQIALRALSERLSKNESASAQWPSMDEPEKEGGDSSLNISVESGSVPATPSPQPQQDVQEYDKPTDVITA